VKCAGLLIPPTALVDFSGMHPTASQRLCIPGLSASPGAGRAQLKDCGANERANKI